MELMVVLCFLAFLSSGTNALQIAPQPTTSFLVEQGHEVLLGFNYTLAPTERDRILTLDLAFNGTRVINCIESKGNMLENNTLANFTGRRDIQILSFPRTYVGLLIEQTAFGDTGGYTWSITIQGVKTSDVPTELIIGNKPVSTSLMHSHVVGIVYTLTCTVTRGIPSPNITMLNGTEVIHTSSASTTTINVTVEFPSTFHCVGTNALGSTDKSSLELPIPTTTMSPTTSTVTSTGENTAKASGSPGNPPNVALIVGVICGCVGGFFIIVILVCVFKKKVHRTKPGKKVLTLEQRVVEGNDNACEQQENTTNLSTEQEQEEKQQQKVKDPRGNTKPAGGDGRKKRSNAEDTEQEQEDKQQRNVEGLQYADLDLRPRGNTKPTGEDGRNKLVFNDDSHVEYAEVRKV